MIAGRIWVATVAFLATLAATPPPADDGLRPMERAQAHQMLRETRQEIEKYYFDPKFAGIDLAKAYATADERISRSKSLPDALSAIAQFTIELGDSHTYFIPPQQTVKVDYGWAMQMVGDVCYIVTVKPGSDAARQGVRRGDRIETVNGYPPTRNNLWQLNYMFKTLRPQPGLHVVLRTPNGVTRELNLEAEVHRHARITDVNSDLGRQQIELDNERVRSTRKSLFVPIEPDVLIWRLPSFAVEESAIAYGLRMATHRLALVIDVRGNGGGAERALLALIGGLSHSDITVGTIRGRDGDKPLAARGAGAGAFDGRLAVLVDSWSGSASELLARTVQLSNRGTVFGDRTSGSVMRGRLSTLTAGYGEYRALFGISVTTADVVMSDAGRLERGGVTPDVEIMPSEADLASGHDPVLAKALTFLGHPTDAEHAGALSEAFREAEMNAR